MILNEHQLSSLSSPLRGRLIEWLSTNGQGSVSEMAEAVGKTPHSLYHHIRNLEGVGLIQIKEQRKAGTQVEAVYEPVSRRMSFSKTSQTQLYRHQLTRTVQGALRRAAKEFDVYQSKGQRDDASQLLRLTVALSASDADQLRAKLAELGNWARSRESSGGETVAFTGLVCPVG